MRSISLLFDQYAVLLWALTWLVIALLAVWVVRAQRRAQQATQRLDELLGDADRGDTTHLLAEYLGTVRRTAAMVSRMESEHARMAALMPSVIRHVGLVRFSPFHDTGGDQSFTLALMDGRRDGVVITALHSRTDSRLYAKPVTGGRSDYSLTPEEREAMDRALRNEPLSSVS